MKICLLIQKVEPLDVDLAIELGMVDSCLDKQYKSWNSGVTTNLNWNSGPIWNNKDIYYKGN